MPSLKRLAILSLAAASVFVSGCDRSSSPDGQVRQKIAEARGAAASGDEAGRGKAESALKEAVSTSNASDASIAQANSVLGEVQLQAAADTLKTVSQHYF
jgi:hypothetical protein